LIVSITRDNHEVFQSDMQGLTKPESASRIPRCLARGLGLLGKGFDYPYDGLSPLQAAENTASRFKSFLGHLCGFKARRLAYGGQKFFCKPTFFLCWTSLIDDVDFGIQGKPSKGKKRDK